MTNDELERKVTWVILRYYAETYLEGLRRAIRNLLGYLTSRYRHESGFPA
jgi:hypothetical protein